MGKLNYPIAIVPGKVGLKYATQPRAGPGAVYGGHSLRSRIEAPLITREVVPETYFLLVIMAADAQAGPFFAVSSIMLMWKLVKI